MITSQLTSTAGTLQAPRFGTLTMSTATDTGAGTSTRDHTPTAEMSAGMAATPTSNSQLANLVNGANESVLPSACTRRSLNIFRNSQQVSMTGGDTGTANSLSSLSTSAGSNTTTGLRRLGGTGTGEGRPGTRVPIAEGFRAVMQSTANNTRAGTPTTTARNPNPSSSGVRMEPSGFIPESVKLDEILENSVLTKAHNESMETRSALSSATAASVFRSPTITRSTNVSQAPHGTYNTVEVSSLLSPDQSAFPQNPASFHEEEIASTGSSVGASLNADRSALSSGQVFSQSWDSNAHQLQRASLAGTAIAGTGAIRSSASASVSHRTVLQQAFSEGPNTRRSADARPPLGGSSQSVAPATGFAFRTRHAPNQLEEAENEATHDTSVRNLEEALLEAQEDDEPYEASKQQPIPSPAADSSRTRSRTWGPLSLMPSDSIPHPTEIHFGPDPVFRASPSPIHDIGSVRLRRDSDKGRPDKRVRMRSPNVRRSPFAKVAQLKRLASPRKRLLGRGNSPMHWRQESQDGAAEGDSPQTSAADLSISTASVNLFGEDGSKAPDAQSLLGSSIEQTENLATGEHSREPAWSLHQHSPSPSEFRRISSPDISLKALPTSETPENNLGTRDQALLHSRFSASYGISSQTRRALPYSTADSSTSAQGRMSVGGSTLFPVTDSHTTESAIGLTGNAEDDPTKVRPSHPNLANQHSAGVETQEKGTNSVISRPVLEVPLKNQEELEKSLEEAQLIPVFTSNLGSKSHPQKYSSADAQDRVSRLRAKVLTRTPGHPLGILPPKQRLRNGRSKSKMQKAPPTPERREVLRRTEDVADKFIMSFEGPIPEEAQRNVNMEYLFVEKKLIGQGHFFEVYRCVERGTGRVVAVKRSIREFRGKNDRALYLNEAKTRLPLGTHRNIVDYHKVWQEKMHIYIQMELLACNLNDYVVEYEHIQQAPIDIFFLLSCAIQIARGLEHLHANGVLHLDIKPDNILVTTSGVLKLGDFGNSRMKHSRLEMADGDCVYMAPELLDEDFGREPGLQLAGLTGNQESGTAMQNGDSSDDEPVGFEFNWDEPTETGSIASDLARSSIDELRTLSVNEADRKFFEAGVPPYSARSTRTLSGADQEPPRPTMARQRSESNATGEESNDSYDPDMTSPRKNPHSSRPRGRSRHPRKSSTRAFVFDHGSQQTGAAAQNAHDISLLTEGEPLTQGELSRKKSFDSDQSSRSATSAADMFSYGLLLLELVVGAQLPKNGPIWRTLRSGRKRDLKQIIRSGIFFATNSIETDYATGNERHPATMAATNFARQLYEPKILDAVPKLAGSPSFMSLEMQPGLRGPFESQTLAQDIESLSSMSQSQLPSNGNASDSSGRSKTPRFNFGTPTVTGTGTMGRARRPSLSGIPDPASNSHGGGLSTTFEMPRPDSRLLGSPTAQLGFFGDLGSPLADGSLPMSSAGWQPREVHPGIVNLIVRLLNPNPRKRPSAKVVCRYLTELYHHLISQPQPSPTQPGPFQRALSELAVQEGSVTTSDPLVHFERRPRAPSAASLNSEMSQVSITNYQAQVPFPTHSSRPNAPSLNTIPIQMTALMNLGVTTSSSSQQGGDTLAPAVRPLETPRVADQHRMLVASSSGGKAKVPYARSNAGAPPSAATALSNLLESEKRHTTTARAAVLPAAPLYATRPARRPSVASISELSVQVDIQDVPPSHSQPNDGLPQYPVASPQPSGHSLMLRRSSSRNLQIGELPGMKGLDGPAFSTNMSDATPILEGKRLGSEFSYPIPKIRAQSIDTQPSSQPSPNGSSMEQGRASDLGSPARGHENALQQEDLRTTTLSGPTAAPQVPIVELQSRESSGDTASNAASERVMTESQPSEDTALTSQIPVPKTYIMPIPAHHQPASPLPALGPRRDNGVVSFHGNLMDHSRQSKSRMSRSGFYPTSIEAESVLTGRNSGIHRESDAEVFFDETAPLDSQKSVELVGPPGADTDELDYPDVQLACAADDAGINSTLSHLAADVQSVTLANDSTEDSTKVLSTPHQATVRVVPLRKPNFHGPPPRPPVATTMTAGPTDDSQVEGQPSTHPQPISVSSQMIAQVIRVSAAKPYPQEVPTVHQPGLNAGQIGAQTRGQKIVSNTVYQMTQVERGADMKRGEKSERFPPAALTIQDTSDSGPPTYRSLVSSTSSAAQLVSANATSGHQHLFAKTPAASSRPPAAQFQSLSQNPSRLSLKLPPSAANSREHVFAGRPASRTQGVKASATAMLTASSVTASLTSTSIAKRDIRVPNIAVESSRAPSRVMNVVSPASSIRSIYLYDRKIFSPNSLPENVHVVDSPDKSPSVQEPKSHGIRDLDQKTSSPVLLQSPAIKPTFQGEDVPARIALGLTVPIDPTEGCVSPELRPLVRHLPPHLHDDNAPRTHQTRTTSIQSAGDYSPGTEAEINSYAQAHRFAQTFAQRHLAPSLIQSYDNMIDHPQRTITPSSGSLRRVNPPGVMHATDDAAILTKTPSSSAASQHHQPSPVMAKLNE